jgi:putative Ca2+/H+ antiporter (TMEM165/GDT1 family)
MNFEKVMFAFFIVLALTLNFGFFIGDIDDPNHHDVLELAGALIVSLIATIMKFGDRSQMGAVLLATSLVADLQLLIAAGVWVWAVNVTDGGTTAHVIARIVSLSGGALLANLVSVTLLIAETISIRR